MSEQRIVVQKQRFLAKRVWLVLCVSVIIVLCGALVQMRMTWSRERVRGITSDAQDVAAATRSGIGQLKPESNPFASIIEIFRDFSE